MPDLPDFLPADLWATIVLSASSVLFGFGVPLAAGVAVLGLVRGFLEERWRDLVLGLLLVVGVVAAGVALRMWGAGLAAELAAANATAAVVFTAVTPPGVVVGVLLVVVGLVRRYVGRSARGSGSR
jgi:hypothetical protein